MRICDNPVAVLNPNPRNVRPPSMGANAGARPIPTKDPPPRRRNQNPRGKPATAGNGGAASRSAYFARREAARVLRTVLEGDARRRAVGTIKSLVYAPSVRNKKATFALVCQTLKYLEVLKRVLEDADVFKGKWKRWKELVYVTAYDALFGQMSMEMEGEVEKLLKLKESALQVALAKLCVREKVKCPEDLVSACQISVVNKPRYARVNTLKAGVDLVIQIFEKEGYLVKKDNMLPDLLVLPSGTDLHNHPLVTSGSVFLQGKASCIPACALSPESGWKVLDACAAPGNKTVQLAAIMKGTGKVLACELNEDRVKHLEGTIKCSGASNIEILRGDFLEINPEDPSFSLVQAILLDPSCSGSGTCAERLDHLLPSNSAVAEMDVDNERIKKLAAFQRKALAHALSFPSAERIVYSTCSIHEVENERVIMSVMPLATSLGFELETPFPQWPSRGLPVFEGSEHLLRTDPADGLEGFFVALFVRKREKNSNNSTSKGATRIVKSHRFRCGERTGLPKKIALRKETRFPIGSSFLKMLLWLGLQRGSHRRRKRW